MDHYWLCLLHEAAYCLHDVLVPQLSDVYVCTVFIGRMAKHSFELLVIFHIEHVRGRPGGGWDDNPESTVMPETG